MEIEGRRKWSESSIPSQKTRASIDPAARVSHGIINNSTKLNQMSKGYYSISVLRLENFHPAAIHRQERKKNRGRHPRTTRAYARIAGVAYACWKKNEYIYTCVYIYRVYFMIGYRIAYSILAPFQIITRFHFSRCIDIIVHLDMRYI